MMDKTPRNSSRSAEQVLSMRELADVLGVSYWTVWRWQREGQIPTIRIGKKFFFRVSAVEARLAEIEAASIR